MRAVNEAPPITIPCNRGMDQSADPRFSALGTFELVQNMRIKGAGLLEKRPGSRAIGALTQDDCLPAFTNAGSSDQPSFIARCGERGMIGSSGGEMFAHQELDDAMIPMGRASTCMPIRRRSSIVGFAEGQSTDPAGYGMVPGSVAVNTSGYVMVAAVSDGDDLTAYIETPDGVRIYTRREAAGTVTRVRVLALGATLLMVWIDGVNLLAQTFTISSGDVTPGVETTLATNVRSGSQLDAAYLSASRWVVAYQDTAPSVDIRILGINSLTAYGAASVTATALAPFSVYANSINIWVGWSNSSNEARYAVYLALDLSPVLASTLLFTGTSPGPPLFGPGPDDSTAISATRNDAALGYLTNLISAPTSGTIGDTIALYGMAPISKPDAQTRIWMIAGTATANSELNRIYLIRAYPYGVARTVTIELSLDEMPQAVSLFQRSFYTEAAGSGGRMYFPAPVVLADIGGFALARVDLLEYSTSTLEPSRSFAQANASLFVAGQPVEALALPLGVMDLNGAFTDRFFAEGAAELGFVAGPTIVVSVGGSGGLDVGDYVFQGVFEWIDARGQRHQSQPSAPFEVTVTSASSGATVLHTVCEYTQRRSALGTMARPWFVLYRTEVDGTELHRVPQADPGLSGSMDGSAADSQIADQEILYSQGDVLANNLAPSCRMIRYAAGRLWCGGLWETDLVEASKIIVPGEQPAFTNDATHRVSIGGAFKGMGVMDDQLVVFLEDAIVSVIGDGPNDQGVNGSFQVRSISSGIGCVDERSILETDVGIFFRSRLGIFLLPRGLGPPQYIGAQVRDVTDDYPTSIGTAVWHGNGHHLARFLITDGGTSVTVNYELNTGQWFKDVYVPKIGAIGVWPEGFVLCKDSLDTTDPSHLALANYPIWIEDTTKVADGVWSGFTGEHIEQRIRTNWILPSGLGGWGEAPQTLCAVVASAAAAMTFRFEVDTSSDAHEQSWTFSSQDAVQYRYLVPLERHGVAFRLSAWDNEISSEPAAGVKFVAFVMESQPDGGLRLPNDGERL